MSDGQNANIKSEDDFKDTPQGQQSRWEDEIKASDKARKRFLRNSRKITRRFLDVRNMSSEDSDGNRRGETRLNVFNTNVQIQRAVLYGNPPEAEIVRRFDDPNDDVARVAAEILGRAVNSDYERQFEYAAGNALDDRLLVGMGQARVRYSAEFEDREVPPMVQPDPLTGEPVEMAPGYTESVKTSESCDTDYVQWKDFGWSPCRVWSECRWVYYRSFMTYDELVDRFGKKKADKIPLNKTERFDKENRQSNSREDTISQDPWMRGEVLEIWSKDDRKVYWFAKGTDGILDSKDDPLKLEGFFPSPEPMMANLTSSAFMPRADYIISQDTYDEIDLVSTRITWLERALKVTGVYDASAVGVERMLKEGVDNELIPVQDWAAFSEQGGTAGTIQFLPIEQIVTALSVLRDYRTELIELLYQQTGMSDIMRGQGSPGATATEQSIKAKFAGIRMNYLQERFASWVTDLQAKRGEIMMEFFDDETLIKMSNMEFSNDVELLQPAIQLLREQHNNFRILITGEALAAEDRAAAINEKAMFMQGLSTYIAAAQPLAAEFPDAMPILLEMMKWSLSSFKGARQIEGVLDTAIKQLQKGEGQEDKPDPEAQAQQLEMAKLKLEEKKLQLENKKIDLEAQKMQQEAQGQGADAQVRMAEARERGELELVRTDKTITGNIAMEGARSKAKSREIQENLDADLVRSDQDFKEDMLKIREDAKLQSQYNPAKTGISGEDS